MMADSWIGWLGGGLHQGDKRSLLRRGCTACDTSDLIVLAGDLVTRVDLLRRTHPDVWMNLGRHQRVRIEAVEEELALKRL